MSPVDLREEVIARALAGARVEEIDRTVIEPAPLDEDEKAALWLLAWSWRDQQSPTQVSRSWA